MPFPNKRGAEGGGGNANKHAKIEGEPASKCCPPWISASTLGSVSLHHAMHTHADGRGQLHPAVRSRLDTMVRLRA
eukprot:1158119-Pelagomonas_calceolata.AAC.4